MKIAVQYQRPKPSHRLDPTYREVEILALLADGLTQKEVGERLHISWQTVRFHSQSFRRKLGARTLAHSIALALDAGWLVLDRNGDGS